jgi:hypothetical protein
VVEAVGNLHPRLLLLQAIQAMQNNLGTMTHLERVSGKHHHDIISIIDHQHRVASVSPHVIPTRQ